MTGSRQQQQNTDQSSKRRKGLRGKNLARLGQHFATFMHSEEAPQPQIVVDAYQALAEMPAGKHPIKDRILKEMQLKGVLGGTDV